MSLRVKSASKRVSAFSIFKGRKANSLSDVSQTNPPSPSRKEKKSKAASASVTPSQSNQASPIVSNKQMQSEKKKQKADLKKIKKLLKSATKSRRPSYLPDSAIQSPIDSLINENGGVQLKSLRPKGSMANLRNYNLPLKAKIELSNLAYTSQNGASPVLTFNESDTPDRTPPLPPKDVRKKLNTDTHVPHPPMGHPMPARQTSSLKRAIKSQTKVPGPELPPRNKVNGEATNGELAEPTLPPQPSKKRKLSGGSSISTVSSILKKQTAGRESREPLPVHPADRDNDFPYMYNSQEEASRLFECLIHPVKPDKFFRELWEKKPLLVKRHMPSYNEGWFSTTELDNILREENIIFGENLDVTSYENGKRETHNPPGRAHGPVVWDYYQNGCSVRMLNPQTYSRNVWKLLSILQEYFNCFVGANVYLTPPGTQGFAPHWDDIEAFILQLEGKKHWRLYSPRSDAETLPRYSSSNFTDADIGDPILDVILEAGDVLYFPKGTIHQGETFDDAHSLHITISCCQKTSWGDLLEQVMPRALQIAIDEDVEFRHALPRDYLNHMGVAFSDSNSPQRTAFLRKLEQLMMKVLSHAPVDAACDQMGKDYIHASLPPVLTDAERDCSIYGSGEIWDPVKNRVTSAIELDPDTEVKIIRKGAIRLIMEEENVSIYHNLENSRIYKKRDPQFIDISADMAPAVECLLHAYPEYITIESLPLDTLEERMEIAAILYDKGMLVTKEALEPVSGGEESETESN